MAVNVGVPPNRGSGPQWALPRRTIVQKVLISIGAIATVLVLVAAGFLFWADRVLSNVATVPVESLETSSGGVSNWLLVGTDTRDGIDESDPDAGAFLDGEIVGGRRTDTMMIARVDTEERSIRLMSVPRDLWVTIPDTGAQGRINGAFAEDGGPARLVSAIQANLGVEIHQYAEVNFVGFIDVIDALGGVPMYFETPMRDPNSGLNIETAGCHTLDGPQALAFARSRSLEYFEDGTWKTDGTGDLGRTTRQRYFLSRVADTTASKANIVDVNEFNRVAQAAGENLQISSGTSTTDLFNLARTFQAVGSEGIETFSLPVVDARINGAAVLELQQPAADEVLDNFRTVVEPPEGTISPTEVQVAVLNGSGESAQAGIASEALARQGFEQGTIGDAPQGIAKTTVVYPPGLEVEAKTVAVYIDADDEVSFEADASLLEVTLVTGSNYIGVRPEPRDVENAPAPTTPATTQVAGPAETGSATEVAELAPEDPGVVPAESVDPATQCS